MTLLQDLRYGARMLRRNPGFTAIAVLTLALGIGANVAVFSLLDAVLLRQLSYVRPNELFMFFPTQVKSGRARASVATSYPNFEDWREQSRSFAAMTGFEEDSFNLTGTAEPERLRGLRSTPGLFELLGIHPVLGREFTRGDGPYVALLSYEVWQRRFSGDSRIVGKDIRLDGWAYTVLGVLPPHFYFPPKRYGGELPPEVFIPAVANVDRGWNYLRVIGRLGPGATRLQAQTEMSEIAARLAQAYPADRDHGVALDPLENWAVSDLRQTAWVLLGAVGFVLLIACANIANLLLARGATREREIAIRSMVGATRSRIVRQLLTESLLLAALGGVFGVALAYWVLPLIALAVPERTAFFVRVHDAGLHLNFAILAFSALLSMLSIMFFGLLPAWKASRPLQSSVTVRRTGRARGALIALEVALSFVLLVGAGLMMKSLVRLLNVDVGFRTERLLSMDVSLPGKKYASPEQQTGFFREVLQGAASLPAVGSVGAITDLPLTRNATWNDFEIPGNRQQRGVAAYHAVSADYFRTMGIPLESGRNIRDSDSALSPMVGVVNRSMAEKYWPNQNPVGTSIVVYRYTPVTSPKGTSVEFRPHQLEIVGVVGDVRQLGLDTPPEPELFIPYTQWPSDEMSLVLRTQAEPASLIPAVKKQVWRVDPDQPVTDIRTMDELVSAEAAGRRFVLQLIGVFASIAVVLAAIGIYGVASYLARQRRHEIAIRLALGAEAQRVVWMVARQNAAWLLLGIVAGVAGALATTRLLSSYLYSVRATDVTTFIAVGFLLTAVAFAASYMPARRATDVDPAVALRCE